MNIHRLEPSRETLHGKFSRELPPVLSVDPGDTIIVRTLDAGWGYDGPEIPRRKFEPRKPGFDDGHALCGPIAVRGAEPGMMLEVQIKAIVPGEWGWCIAGGWPSPTNVRLGLAQGELGRQWKLDRAIMTGRDDLGFEVPLAPFMGVMGVAPAEPGFHSTTPPRLAGGNIDCKELVAGSSLFLPVEVPGALFSLGDGHAAQGDGEISGVAIECPMEKVEISFQLHRESILHTPHAPTPAGFITFGFDANLNEASHLALEAMLKWLQVTYALTLHDAAALASVCVDLRVTQIVNQVCGVHAILPVGKPRKY